ncbi:prepilin-type N-terminal cleavage/methylation domain-containing protein [Verrucomicrobiaceae bacterium R5-34]|uniref:Prepilin-type N-terminal cleavage/methylation domain-containing protein n=1 Tax=Oceaniferula flava TaxID=2800421 RepID=A0AAE2VCX1_9BACT|nr:prepilin-type N-terminal cleavage/methylation domain-containing protein [Oceaniferula flavus]MBK1829623.1 prepilin-type N-terminal cleavage/methylation domain-containing protein [Verrucomicrobiaceae bacterium R5-34]MBK1853814.1 prepilin-type N-terminal cleavage/methylation domain-containing protein [Oceaniferula flavus]MBM1135120.1 prepilin-type N-terminal cleavage/methylation domain-containing protein [Oceaniferula flavus]
MKVKHSSSRSSVGGFTLVEIIVVIAIIAVLATMTVGGLSFYKQKAAENKTKVFIASVSRALDEYHSDFNEYPEETASDLDDSTEILYRELYGDGADVNVGTGGAGTTDGSPDEGATVYLDALNPNLAGSQKNVEESGGEYFLIDGFRNRLRYRNDPNSPDMQNPDYDLWSAGRDGDDDEEKDNIDNW